MKIVIVEDESAAAKNLESILHRVAPQSQIIATLESVEESVDYFSSHPMPDLVFMDIHLADGDSFLIFNSVDITAPVIFATAYDEYALRAFEVNSIDYILKPLSEEDVKKALDKLKLFSNVDTESLREKVNNIAAARSEQSRPVTLLAHVKDRIVPIEVEDSAFFYISEDRVKVTTLDGSCYPIDKSLEQLAELLPEHDFHRANRQFIISRKAVKDISVWFGSRLSINLVVEIPEKIIVSKARVSRFKEWIQSIHS
ncbi:MAG: LytTR family DNA-binding domain-containing protein [Rikenellaceae bacterium]